MSDERVLAALPAHPAWALGNILDVRPAAEFAAGHLRPAVNIPLPEDPVSCLPRELPSVFLPPRHEPLLVVASRPEVAEAVCEHLRRCGRSAVEACTLTPQALLHLPAAAVGRGPTHGHLWRPPAFLVTHRSLLLPTSAGAVLDLGAGSCRASVWLAERGYRVTAVDRDPSALQLGRRLAEGRSVACTFLQRDLRDPAAVPAGRWAIILAFRFLERPLLRKLPDMLLPGGVAMVQSFRYVSGCDRLPAPRHLLEPGELLELVPAETFCILVHQEDHDADGLPMAGIVARRRRGRLEEADRSPAVLES